MEGPARVSREPGAYFGMLVSSIIVEDRVDQLAGRHSGFDAVQKADEFLVAMPRHAVADHRAVEDIECREQRGRAVADVIVGHGSGPAALDRQAGLGAGRAPGFAISRRPTAPGCALAGRDRARPRRAIWRQKQDPATA